MAAVRVFSDEYDRAVGSEQNPLRSRSVQQAPVVVLVESSDAMPFIIVRQDVNATIQIEHDRRIEGWSIMQAVNSPNFMRTQLFVGKPGHQFAVADGQRAILARRYYAHFAPRQHMDTVK